VFEESNAANGFVATGNASFVLRPAIKRPHELVMGYYSVHTSAFILERGETEISRIGQRSARKDDLPPRLDRGDVIRSACQERDRLPGLPAEVR
jgi:hypothetical protein